MRTLLRALVCAVVIGAMGGCGGGGDVVVPKKFAPPPPKGAQSEAPSNIKTKMFSRPPAKPSPARPG
jgi:predicted small lipoprotein YifL